MAEGSNSELAEALFYWAVSISATRRATASVPNGAGHCG